MTKSTKIFIYLFIIIESFHPFALATWEDKIVSNGDGFYVAKIENRDLWLVMEKISDRNIKIWRQYAEKHNDERISRAATEIFPHYTLDGAKFFQWVLFSLSYRQNDIWVAYVTMKSNPSPITQEDLENYYPGTLGTPANDIVMFMTMVTSPNALLTSHMGISVTYEGLVKKIRGVSLDLHSFAAKVALIQSPSRKYMVNAPATAMEEIIAQAMPPQTFFAGTRGLIGEVERKLTDKEKALRNATFNEEKIATETKLAQESAEDFQPSLEKIKKAFANQEINEEQFRNKLDALKKRISVFSLTIVNSEIIVDHETIKQNAMKTARDISNLPLLRRAHKLLLKYPSLMSVDDGYKINESFTIYDKNNQNQPWLTVTNENFLTYQWMFTDPFAPHGETHYIVVDLNALANSRKLE